MREGSLDAPIRHPVAWQEKSFYDEQALDKEMRRVFDICHGCRRCFNLCDSFPRLFDLIDESASGELDSVDSKDFQQVTDACTLCDMCFLTKCPYVPPHEFNLDFPHLILRKRAIDYSKKKIPVMEQQLTKTDRNGKAGCATSAVANWAIGNKPMRVAAEKIAGIDRNAKLPSFAEKPYIKEVSKHKPLQSGRRKALLYITCSANYNSPAIARSAMAVLEKNGVQAEYIYPECCGMPQLEHGNLAEVAARAMRIAAAIAPYVDKGYDVVSLVPSCTLMLKFEWSLLLPDNAQIRQLSQATSDISEYVVDIAKNEGLQTEPNSLPATVALHVSCHSRAQNMGQKAAQMLRLLPEATVNVIERCSGHGGSWGVMKKNFSTALRVGKPVARQAHKLDADYLVSECPLAREHIVQGMENLQAENIPQTFQHPIEIFALAYD